MVLQWENIVGLKQDCSNSIASSQVPNRHCELYDQVHNRWYKITAEQQRNMEANSSCHTASSWLTLVKVMAWCPSGTKPLPEPMLIKIHDCMASPGQKGSSRDHDSLQIYSEISWTDGYSSWFREILHFSIKIIWFRRKPKQNPLAWLTVLFALGSQAAGYIEPRYYSETTPKI